MTLRASANCISASLPRNLIRLFTKHRTFYSWWHSNDDEHVWPLSSVAQVNVQGMTSEQAWLALVKTTGN